MARDLVRSICMRRVPSLLYSAIYRKVSTENPICLRRRTPLTGFAPNSSGKMPNRRRSPWQFGARWSAAPTSSASSDRSKSCGGSLSLIEFFRISSRQGRAGSPSRRGPLFAARRQPLGRRFLRQSAGPQLLDSVFSVYWTHRRRQSGSSGVGHAYCSSCP